MRKQTHHESGGKAGLGRSRPPSRTVATPPSSRAVEARSEADSRDPLPHRAAMEQAFGLSFGDVEVRTGAGDALDAMNANAATQGSRVQFREGNPRPAQVAHELTHVLQQRHPAGETGISTPDSAAEREAARNAIRVDLGLTPKMPRERASPNAIYRDVKTDLRKAMAGWGTDEDSIYATLGNANDDEKEAIRSDPALMGELKDDLTRGEWVKVLNLVSQGLETQIRAAGAGWGTDEAGIYQAVEQADAAALKEMLGNGTLLAYLRDELTNGELGRVLGTAADTLISDAGTTKQEVFHYLMLFPDAVNKACDYFELKNGANAMATKLISLLPTGAAMPAETVADADIHINKDGNKNRIMATFRRRWDFSTGRLVVKPVAVQTTGSVDWTVGLIRKVHKALKMVPAEHVTQTTSDIVFLGVDPSLKGTSTAGYWAGSIGSIGLDEEATNLASTVRHEVGHAVDGLLGATSAAWKKGAPNNWSWGETTKVWEDRMPDAWIQDDGIEVSDADKQEIRDLLEDYAKTTKAKGGLRSYARAKSATHKILDYWGKSVPLIEAAKSIAGMGSTMYNSKTSMMKNNGARFTWKPNRSDAFLVFSEFVWDSVPDNYALHNHPEFFAMLYEKYYEDGQGDERLNKFKVVSWQNFFDNTVHGAK